MEWAFFTPEKHNYRVRPSSRLSGHDDDQLQTLAEPIPAAFTLARLEWSFSLWSSWRGIGWNYQCPLPESSAHPLYSRTAPRRPFILNRLRWLMIVQLINEVSQWFMILHSPAFHTGLQSYNDLTVVEKAFHSICLVARVYVTLHGPNSAMSIVFVLLGGWWGWEGEMWSPWGWPPVTGNILEAWKHPGLSTTWSRVGHHGRSSRAS